MTDLLIHDDPNDTGEIRRIDDLGTEPTRDLSAHRDRLIGEATQNMGPYQVDLGFPLRRPDATGELPALIDTPLGLSPADLDGPQPEPPPLPPAPAPAPQHDMAAAQPIAPWERVAGADETAVHTLLGSLAGGRELDYRGRHRLTVLGRLRRAYRLLWAGAVLLGPALLALILLGVAR